MNPPGGRPRLQRAVPLEGGAALARTPEQEDDFTGTQISTAQLITRLSKVNRVWLIEIDRFSRYGPLQGHGWHLTRQWPVSDFTLTLCTRS